jgi:hypothetical protein
MSSQVPVAEHRVDANAGPRDAHSPSLKHCPSVLAVTSVQRIKSGRKPMTAHISNRRLVTASESCFIIPYAKTYNTVETTNRQFSDSLTALLPREQVFLGIWSLTIRALAIRLLNVAAKTAKTQQRERVVSCARVHTDCPRRRRTSSRSRRQNMRSVDRTAAPHL